MKILFQLPLKLFSLVSFALLSTTFTYASEPIDLNHQQGCGGRYQNSETRPSFFCDAHSEAELRLFSFSRDRQNSNDSQATALSGMFRITSGRWTNLIRTSAAWYTSRGIDKPKDKPGSQLLRPVQKDINTFGEAWLELQLSANNHLKVGRQVLNLPYLDKHFARALPTTYQGYVFTSKLQQTQIKLAYIDKVKTRASDRFITMSERAGVTDSRKGLASVYLQHQFDDDTTLKFINNHTQDVFNTSYAELLTRWHLDSGRPINVAIQATYQTSIGKQLLEKFDTHHLGLKLSTPINNIDVRFVATHTSNQRNILRPYSTSPAYTSIIHKDFDRAGEDAVMLGFSYDFKHLDIPGLSTFANIAYGNTPDHGSIASPDQSEIDLTIDYKLPLRQKDKLAFRFRFASVNQTGTDAVDATDLHLIMVYKLSLF